jgi:O-antigen/teichoic acid export membrane protein
MSVIKKLLSGLAIDKAVAFTIMSRLVQGFGGLGSIVFIAKYLLPKEQGYYYTFASIIAIQVFFELGLGNILTQYTAYEFAHLSWVEDKLEGSQYHKSRLSSLLKFFVKWFGIVSILLFFSLWAVGYYFFSNYNITVNVDWKNPWFILCMSTSCNLFIDPILAYFDGLGYVENMSKVRFVQKTSNVVFLCLFFVLGFGLYSSALSSLLSILINYGQILLSKKRKLLVSIWQETLTDKIDYYSEIFPYQWRIAVSWISGFFIFQLFNPVLFATEGSVVAGQMGMTLQALTGIGALGMSWITTKTPLFSNLISKKLYNQLDFEFRKTLKSLIIVITALLVIFVISIISFNDFIPKLRMRFLPTFALICLALAVLLNQIINALAIYMRCHKKEPLLLQSVVSAIYCTISTLLFGKIWGLNGIVTSYFVWIIISLFWINEIFKKKKVEWHTI